MGKPDAPQPPNPYTTAQLQTGTNVSTAVANSFLNNMNQNTPQGSLVYDVTGNYSWTDPSTGSTYNIPRWTANQTLTPFGQQLQNANQNTQLTLANMAGSQASRVSNLLASPFDPSASAPAAGSAEGIAGVPGAATSYDMGGDIQSTFGDAGDLTRTYGAGDFSADRQNVQDALMARLNPQLDRERSGIEQRLADQGIRYGSQAYASAMDDYNRQANDARYGAISQAGQEQARMMQMAGQRATFENQAQQQAYDQLQGRGAFANQAQAQQNAQNAAAAGFQNQGLAQQLAQQQSIFNAQNSSRNQYMQEQYQQRNQPINEISALLGQSQVQQPNWLNAPTSQIPTTDIGGLINQNFNQQQQNYQTGMQSWNSVMGGILGLGAGALRGGLLSDERAKENIKPMGTVYAMSDEGERRKLPIYQYSYKADPASSRHVGPMAQDVEKITPRAVASPRGQYKRIDPSQVMGSIMRAA